MNEFTEIDRLCNIFIKYRKENPIRMKWESSPPIEFTPKVLTKFKDKENNGLPEFRAYREEVYRLTELVAHLVPGVEKRGFRNHHIDHKISIWYGFKNGISPEVVADIKNLRMLPYKENLRKGIRCEQ
jgi:hypothetical protein